MAQIYFLNRNNFTGNHHAGNHFFRAGVFVSGHCILCFHLITFYHEKNLSIKGKSLSPYGHITAIKSVLIITKEKLQLASGLLSLKDRVYASMEDSLLQQRKVKAITSSLPGKRKIKSSLLPNLYAAQDFSIIVDVCYFSNGSFVACFVLLQLCWFCVCLVVCCFMFSLEFHPSITYFPDDFSSRCADDGMGFPVAAVCRPGSIGFVLFGGEFQRYGEVVVVMVVMVVMVGGAELLMWGGWMLMWCG
ncbi:hypothetical protein P8452_47122 [Trifolium repens]|nr:hypothetical protein P8452_47122 [Trifolium repens]